MKKAIVFILLSLGVWHISTSGYMLAKAQLSQHLIKDAWQKTLLDKQKHKPWSWADTYPVFEISVPRLNQNSYILEGASGRNMAFSAARISNSGMPGQMKSTVISGHRDSHFEYLQEIQLGDELIVETVINTQKYKVINVEVVDSSLQSLMIRNVDEIILSTCYPFNQLQAGGNLRYVITTKPVNSNS